jgi:membrane-associated phospholipid phosphatase
MLRRPGPPLLVAAACAALLAITGVLAKLVPVTEQGDAHTLQGFVGLQPHLWPVMSRVAHLADPGPYALVGLGLILLALLRGRPRVAAAIPVVFVLTGLTTETLKVLVASPRVHEWLGGNQIDAASWPSGHATAAMTMALCAVMVAPPRLRPTVAALGGAFAIGVAYAILTLAWHFPSDVFGGYLVAATYVMLALSVLAALERRRPSRARGESPARTVDALPAVAIAVGAAGAAVGLALTRPRALVGYAEQHTTFVAGAIAIAVLAAMLATLLALGFRGGGRRSTTS